MDAKEFLRNVRKSERRLARGAKPKKYKGLYVGGKWITKFSQIKVKPAGKKSLREKAAGGIKLAIL